jgi:hypothetical protein
MAILSSGLLDRDIPTREVQDNAIVLEPNQCRPFLPSRQRLRPSLLPTTSAERNRKALGFFFDDALIANA